MNGFGYGTRGLLLPAISLLMLAHTNRFLGLASVARDLVTRHREQPNGGLRDPVRNLRARITLLRHTQAQGVLPLLLCTSSLFALFLEAETWARGLFGAALLSRPVSLGLSLREIYLSERALHIELDELLPKS